MVVLVAVAAVLATPPPAHAWSSLCCMPWQAPDQVVISNDGRFAYSSAYNVTLAMARDPATGALTVVDSYDIGGGAMELSPDSSSLYVASGSGPLMAEFAR